MIYRAHHAFTLIELAIVMTITSMLVVALSFRLLGPWEEATIQTDLERIKAIDEFARREAIELTRSVDLVFDKTQGLIRVVDPESDRGLRTCRLSHLTKLMEVRVIVPRESSSNRQLALRVSELGSSWSYALRIQTGKKQRWLLFVGQTGQILDDVEEQDVENFFAMLPPSN